MKRRGHLRKMLPPLAALSLLTACFLDMGLAGGGSGVETTNGLAGTILEGSGPAPGVAVAVFTRDFDPHAGLPSDLPRDTTDALGKFLFPELPAGSYTVLARNPDDGSMAIIQDIVVRAKSRQVLPPKRLARPGTVSIPADGLLARGGGYLYIPGSDLFLDLPARDSIPDFLVLDKVPEAGYLRILYVEGDGSPGRNILADTLAVTPGDTARLHPYFQWAHSDSLYFNTAADGAGVQGDVTGFPLLIRLDKSRFDFSQADSAGRDIRCAKPDGTPLPLEIERWDAGLGRAEIWVRMDTVRGNSRSQFLTLHWGRAGAGNASRPFAVFDSASGFAGVWHLGQEATDTTAKGLYRNSARDADHGDDHLHTTDREGLIGYGHYFDGTEHIRMPAPGSQLKPARNITVSGWYKASASDSGGAVLATMGDSYGLKMDHNGKTRLFVYVDTRHNSPLTDLSVMDGRWHHLTGSYDGAKLHSYVDGVLVISEDQIGDIAYSLGSDFFIGKHGNGATNVDALGHIDEVRVSRAALSPDWIKLSYMNQKEAQAQLEFR
jgi:hypothetical protein